MTIQTLILLSAGGTVNRAETGRMTTASLTLASMIAAILATTAQAQEQAQTSDTTATSGLEVIEVTARRTEESAQSVPVSLTALSAATLDANAIQNVGDLQTSVPGLLVTLNSQGGAPVFAIRAAKADNGTSDTVTAYVDDVPVSSTRAVANMMYDMQSISTLKGPQGTLFGANATGGAIIFRPNKPANEFEGYAKLGYGNWDRMEFEGMVNVPVTDTFAVRLAGSVIQRDGYVENATPVNGNDELTDIDRQSARLSMRWEPGDQFQNDLMIEYFKENAQPFTENLVALRPAYQYTTFLGAFIPDFPSIPVDYAAAGITVPKDNEHVALGPMPTWNDADILSVIEAASYALNDDVDLKLVIGWQDTELDTAQDNDATTQSGVNGRTLHEIERWTIEPSIDWSFMDGRLRNKTGLFYSTTETTTGNSYRVVGLPFNFTDLGGPDGAIAATVNSFYPIQVNNLYTRDMDSQAIYSQFAYDLTDTLTATIGLRYTKDKGDYSARNFQSFGAASVGNWGDFTAGNCNTASINLYKNPDPVNCIAYMDMDSSATSYNVTLESQVNDGTMVYAASRGGYIAGGFNNQANPTVSGIPFVFDPEEVVDFEMGIKSDWELAGRPIRTNLAGFYGSYEGQQRVQNGTTPEGVTFIGVVNAGSSTYYGLDLEVTYQLTDMLTASIGWNHLKSEYTNFEAIVNIPGVYAFVDLQGEPMSRTPENVVTAGLTAIWPVGSNVGEISSTLSAFYRDATLAFDSPTVAGPVDASGQLIGIDPERDFRQYDELESFTLLNFTTGWNRMFGSNFDASVWVKNLTDEEYNVSASNQMLQFGYATYWYGTPREYGIEVRYSF
jgi:iron complex outermembrane recepter protein